MKKRLIAIIVVLNSGCTINPSVEKDSEPNYVPVDVMAVKDAIPKYEKRTRAGNPAEYVVLGKKYKVLSKSQGYKKKGLASWYGVKFHGRKTSNGEVYNMYAMTAAHKTLPIPSYVRVTNLKNKRSVVVRVNDRGPFHQNRIIDLSYTAAVKLGLQKSGTGLVEVTALDFDSAGGKEKEKISQIKPIEPLKPTGLQEVFYLQVGAFSSSANAMQLQQKLRTSDVLDSRIQQEKNLDKAIYKVQVGPLYSEQQTQLENEKLVQIGLKNSQLIVEKMQINSRLLTEQYN